MNSAAEEQRNRNTNYSTAYSYTGSQLNQAYSSGIENLSSRPSPTMHQSTAPPPDYYTSQSFNRPTYMHQTSVNSAQNTSSATLSNNYNTANMAASRRPEAAPRPSKQPEKNFEFLPTVPTPDNDFVVINRAANYGQQPSRVQTAPNIPKLPKPVITIDFDREFGTIREYFNQTSDPQTKQFNRELQKNQKLSAMRKSLINNKYLSDVKIYAGPAKTLFYGHKMFLITSSSFFKESIMDGNNTEIFLSEISPDILLELLKYCYTGDININMNNVNDMQSAARKLKFLHVNDRCNGFVSKTMNPVSVFQLFESASGKNDKKVIDDCITFIKKNEEKCFDSEGFYKTSLDDLVKILQMCNFQDASKIGNITEKWTHKSAKSLSLDLENVPVVAKEEATSSNLIDLDSHFESLMKASCSKDFSSELENLMRSEPKKPSLADSIAEKLITCEKSVKFAFDDDDEKSSMCGGDKDDNVRSTIELIGKLLSLSTQLSVTNFVCKKSLLLHLIYFTCDLAERSTEFSLSVNVTDGNRNREIFTRKLKHDPNVAKYRMSRFFFKKPLRIFVGQKFAIKVHFSKPCQQRHVAAEKLSNEHFIQLSCENEKKYFNCVSKIVVSEIPKDN